MSLEPKTFTRATSGFVQEFDTHDVFVFNVVAYAMGLVLAVTPTFLGGLYPSADILLVLTFGVLLSLFNGLTYGLLGAAMPRSGGDYVFIGRGLRPSVGFAASWGLTWSQFFGIGVYTGWCVRDALAPALVAYGYSAGNERLIDFGNQLASGGLTALVGTGLLACVLVISLLGMRTFKRFLEVFFYIALAGTIAMGIVYWTSSHGEFVQALNSRLSAGHAGSDIYKDIIDLGRSQGVIAPQRWSFWESLKALPVGYWVFIGFTFSVYVGNEVRRPEKAQLRGIIGALVFGYVAYVLILAKYYQVVGGEFNNAASVVTGAEGSPLSLNSMPYFATVLTSSLPLSFLISFSTFLWYFLLLFVMVQVCVRNLFAWSQDRLMPPQLTKQSRHAVPAVALFVTVAIGEVFLLLHSFVGIPFINYIALFSVCFLVAGVSAVVWPIRKPADFERSHPVVRVRLLGVPVLQIAGVGNILLFALVLWSSLTTDLGGVSGLGSVPFVVLLAIYASGVVWFSLARRYRLRKDGFDPEIALEELPPE